MKEFAVRTQEHVNDSWTNHLPAKDTKAASMHLLCNSAAIF